jgi:hypothetical protein
LAEETILPLKETLYLVGKTILPREKRLYLAEEKFIWLRRSLSGWGRKFGHEQSLILKTAQKLKP